MEGAGEVAQILTAEVQGLKIGVELGKDAVKLLQRLIAILFNAGKDLTLAGMRKMDKGKVAGDNLQQWAGDMGVTTAMINQEHVNDLIKYAKKAGIKFTVLTPTPDKNNPKSPVYIMYAKKDADVFLDWYDRTYKDTVKSTVKEEKNSENISYDSLGKGENDTKASMELEEYTYKSGMMDMSDEEFDKSLTERYGPECKTLEDFKKEAERNLSSEAKKKVNDDISKKVHESDLKRDELGKDSMIFTFENTQIFEIDKQNQKIMFRAKDTDYFLEISMERVKQNADGSLTAVINKDTKFSLNKIIINKDGSRIIERKEMDLEKFREFDKNWREHNSAVQKNKFALKDNSSQMKQENAMIQKHNGNRKR